MHVRRIAGRTIIVFLTTAVLIAGTAVATSTFFDSANINVLAKSNARAKIVDLSIASYDINAHTCGAFNKGTLATSSVVISDYNAASPNAVLSETWFCLKNQGARPTDQLTAKQINVVATDDVCTNDE